MIDEMILVLHVREGYEDRKEHIDKMMNHRGYTFEYILDGDICDLTDDILNKYFTGEMHQRSAATSCAMKHLLACKYIIEHNLHGALILEDDMVLYSNFELVFNESMKELRERNLHCALISFEDSCLIFVPRSERIRGQHLYAKHRDRFAGSLYYTREAAEFIISHATMEHCNLPIDLWHTALISKGLGYYWCHPCIATQGTHTGLFASSINLKSAARQHYRQKTWRIKLFYKKMLYLLR